MGKEFEIHHDTTVDTDPETVWDTIATGPGISTWFIGRTDITGDTVRTSFGKDWIPAGTVTTTDRPHHFAHGSHPEPDGRHIAYEYLIDTTAGSTVLRTVTSGFLPGDDWADEYEAMHHGTALFFATLRETLTHFPGRTATPHTTFGPPVTDWPTTWQRLHDNLRDTGPDAHTYHRNDHTIGIRTPHGLYRYLRGRHGGLIAAHALFHGTPETPYQNAWKAAQP